MNENRETELGVTIRRAFERVDAVTADEVRAAARTRAAGRRRPSVLLLLLLCGVALASVLAWWGVSGGSSHPVAVGAAVGDGRVTPEGWWPGPSPEDPLYEDLKFREMFGLSVDRDHIEQVRQNWDGEAGQALLVPVAVTDHELEVVREKLDLGALFTAAAPRIESVAGEGFAGVEIELDRSVVVVRFQEGSPELDSEEFRTQVLELIPEPLSVELLAAEFAMDELVAYSEAIKESSEWLAEQGVDIALHGVAQSGNRVMVYVRSSDPAEQILADVAPLEALDIVYSDACVVRGSTTMGWEGWSHCQDERTAEDDNI